MFKKFSALLCGALITLLPFVAQAQYGLQETAKKAFGDNSPIVQQQQNPDSIFTITGNIINIVLGLLGIIFLILIIVGGIQWMLSSGDQGRVDAARKLLTNAVIGLALVLTAYAISFFVIQTLITAVTTA